MDANGQHRTHGHDPRIPQTPRPALPGRRNVKDALWRVLGAAAVLAAAMGAGLWAAKTYLVRDWAERVDAAKHLHPAAAENAEAPEGRAWNPRDGRQGGANALDGLSRLDGGRSVFRAGGSKGGGWMVCARGFREGRLAERALALAWAAGAPEEEVWTASGTAALKARQVRRAYRWFGMALEAKPGHAAALRGRAICGARLGMGRAALADAAAYLGRAPHDAAALRLAAALLCEESREGEALALLEREVAEGGERRLCLDAAELAARAGAMETALRYLDAAAEGEVSLGDVAQVFKGPLFDGVRGADEGRAFTRRLAARARAKEGAGK